MTVPTTPTVPAAASVRLRAADWLGRWGPVLPLLAAEFVTWVGFGALLPVLPLYFTEQGVDLSTLGVVVAAWPAARLVGEPVFGWLADRTRRVPLMVAGLVGAAITLLLPLAVTGAAAFVVLRALSGLATAMYDPAARGYLTDATPPERRGEAFGIYSAAQMGGLLLGPAIGALGASALGGVAFVFWFGAAATLVAAVAIALTVRERPHGARVVRYPSSFAEFPAATSGDASRAVEPALGTPSSLLNRRLVAAIAITAGASFAYGAYEVVWSLYLQWRGAGLDLIGLTFALFGLPVLIASPFAGRLVDRRGSLGPIVVGSLVAAITGVIYPFIEDPVLVIPFILLEGAGSAALQPALFTVVAAGSPPGRSSTAQGLFGAAGTVGFIVASLVSGALAAIDLRYPFFVFSAVMLTALAVGLAIGRRTLRGHRAADYQ